MKTITFTAAFLLISLFTIGQTINIQGGTSVSKMDWKDKLNNTTYKWYDEEITGYSFLIGVNYLEKKFFNLSSNIGIIKKGGKENFEALTFDQPGDPLQDITISTYLEYLTINTTIDLKYDIKNYGSPFISVGPRFDYLIKYSEEFDDIKENKHLNNYNIGLLLGAGYRYTLFNFQFGVRADYYLNFMSIADWSWSNEGINFSADINDQTYTLNLILGYKFN